MAANFKIFAALAEESLSPWIWSSYREYKSRTLVIVSLPDKSREICCEYRRIDANFEHIYRDRSRTLGITDPAASIVINEWYREKLGITTQTETALDIRKTSGMIGNFRFYLTHPDRSMRFACHLAFVSVILGSIALVPQIGSFFALVGSVIKWISGVLK
jgi:hypothetical protein